MKNKPLLVKMSVAMIPLVLIATYSLAGGIIFGAFLDQGPDLREMTQLVNLTLSKRCVYEMLLTAAAFLLLMLVYSIAYRLKPLEWLMTFGMEILATISLLVLYGGLLIENFPFTILDLCDQSLFLARWPIYGYFTVLFKCVVLILSLFLGLLVRERKERPENEEEKYGDLAGFYEKKALRYLVKNNVLTGIFLFLFSAAAETFLVWNIAREGTGLWDPASIFTMLFAGALFLAPGAFGAALFYRSLRPRTSVAYRQLLAMGDRDRVLRLFCEEIVDGRFPEPDLLARNYQIQTAHFRFWRQNIRSRVEWRGEHL